MVGSARPPVGRAAVQQDERVLRLTLWTNDNLVAARRIYQAAGYVLEHEYPHAASVTT